MIVRNNAPSVPVGVGSQRKLLAAEGSLMAAEVSFEKGGIGALHSHPHEQIGYIVKGSLELECDGTKEILSAGDSYYIKPNMLHGVVALEDTVILDVFTPQRADFKK